VAKAEERQEKGKKVNVNKAVPGKNLKETHGLTWAFLAMSEPYASSAAALVNSGRPVMPRYSLFRFCFKSDSSAYVPEWEKKTNRKQKKVVEEGREERRKKERKKEVKRRKKKEGKRERS